MAVGSEVVVGPEFDNRSAYAYSAIFAEVKVSPHTGMYKITRVVGAYDCGRIVNPKTAISQCKGGIIMGISYACREETAIDHRLHRIVNNNFADYHIAVQADIPPIDVLFIEEPDPYVGSLGIKGLGKLLSVEYQLPLPMHFFMQPVSAYVGFLLLLKNYSSYNSS
jgi:xanthine dehydrogenase YagR molybdenum-binding subunit